MISVLSPPRGATCNLLEICVQTLKGAVHLPRCCVHPAWSAASLQVSGDWILPLGGAGAAHSSKEELYIRKEVSSSLEEQQSCTHLIRSCRTVPNSGCLKLPNGASPQRSSMKSLEGLQGLHAEGLYPTESACNSLEGFQGLHTSSQRSYRSCNLGSIHASSPEGLQGLHLSPRGV